jgi:hypothetical protein
LLLVVSLGRGRDVGGLESIDLLGQFGNARTSFVARLMSRGGEAGLSRSRKVVNSVR